MNPTFTVSEEKVLGWRAKYSRQAFLKDLNFFRSPRKRSGVGTRGSGGGAIAKCGELGCSCCEKAEAELAESWLGSAGEGEVVANVVNVADVLLTGSSHLEASGLLGSGWRLVDIATRAGNHLYRPQTWLDYTVTVWMEAEGQRGLPLQLSASHPWKWYRR